MEKSPQPGTVGLSAASSFGQRVSLDFNCIAHEIFLLQLGGYASKHILHAPGESVGLVNASILESQYLARSNAHN